MEQRLIDLNRFFREKGMSPQDIAAKVGRSRQNVIYLLTGKNNFILKTACLFSEAFGLSPAWLMTGKGNMMGKMQGGEVGDRLRLFMEKKGLSVTNVYKQTNISQSLVSQVLAGTSNVTASIAERLSNALGISTSWLLTGEGEMEVEGWTPPAELPAAPVRVRNTDGGSSSKMVDLRRENAELRAEVERLRGQVSQLLIVVQNLTGGKTEQ